MEELADAQMRHSYAVQRVERPFCLLSFRLFVFLSRHHSDQNIQFSIITLPMEKLGHAQMIHFYAVQRVERPQLATH